MLDLRRVREEPDVVRAALAKRDPGLTEAVDRILELDASRRDGLGEVNELKAERNRSSRQIGELKRSGGDASALVEEMRVVGDRISEIDDRIRVAEDAIEEILLGLPNTPLDRVPVGGEAENEVLAVHGSPPEFGFEPKPHWEIGESLGILDLPRGSTISGSGFPVLRGAGARLQRALINFFLDVHVDEHGYEEMRVPYLVNRDTMIGTGQLPKFADESYQIERDDLWLIPTAEVPGHQPPPGRDARRRRAADTLHGLLALLPAGSRAPPGRTRAGSCGCTSSTRSSWSATRRPERSREALEELTREAETLLDGSASATGACSSPTGDLGFRAAR